METNSYYIAGTDASCLTKVQARQQLKNEGMTFDDDLVQEFIDSAQVECENYIGRAIGRRKYVVELSVFDDPFTFQANFDNDTIDKIEYYPAGATEKVVLASEQYKLRKSTTIGCLEIKFLSVPATAERDDAVIITINQGWEISKVPAPIKQAMRLLISDAYERREDRGEIGYNTAAHAKLRPYRRY